MYFDLTSGESHPSPLWRNDMTWYGSHGFGVAENIDDYYKYFIFAINTAFTDRKIDLDLMVCEGTICGAHGYLVGNFTGPLLGKIFFTFEKSLFVTRHKVYLFCNHRLFANILGEKPTNLQTHLKFGTFFHRFFISHYPSSMYSCSIGHILEHEFFCLGRLGSSGSKGKKSGFELF